MRRMIKSGLLRGQKRAFFITVRDRHSPPPSFLLCSFAVFQCLPRLPPFCDTSPLPSFFFPIMHRQNCKCKTSLNSLLILSRNTGKYGGFTWVEDEGPSKLPACLPAALFSALCATHTMNNLSPSLFCWHPYLLPCSLHCLSQAYI